MQCRLVALGIAGCVDRRWSRRNRPAQGPGSPASGNRGTPPPIEDRVPRTKGQDIQGLPKAIVGQRLDVIHNGIRSPEGRANDRVAKRLAREGHVCVINKTRHEIPSVLAEESSHVGPHLLLSHVSQGAEVAELTVTIGGPRGVNPLRNRRDHPAGKVDVWTQANYRQGRDPSICSSDQKASPRLRDDDEKLTEFRLDVDATIHRALFDLTERGATDEAARESPFPKRGDQIPKSRSTILVNVLGKLPEQIVKPCANVTRYRSGHAKPPCRSCGCPMPPLWHYYNI